MLKKHIYSVTLFFYFLLSTISAQAEAIRDIQFTWVEDELEELYYSSSPYTPRTTGSVDTGIINGYEVIGSNIDFTLKENDERVYGGTAILKTLILTGADGVTRTVDAEQDFIFPSTYKYSAAPGPKKLFTSQTTGYYDCVNAAAAGKAPCNSVTEYYNALNTDTTNITETNYLAQWSNAAEAAFSDKNLNHYIGGNSGVGRDFYQADLDNDANATRIANAGTARHLLSYDHGVKVGFGGDGYVIVSERGGNNSFYLLARDMSNNILGDIYVLRAPGSQCSNARAGEDPSGSNTTPYIASGRMQDNFQEICVAVYPIQDLAPPGSTIGSIEMWAAGHDAGDGKVILVHSLEAPEVCYDYTVRQNGHTLPSDDRNFSSIANGDISISLALRSMQADYNMTKVRLLVDVPLVFKNAKYSPNQLNSYIPGLYIFGSHNPEIAFGKDAVGGVNGGGTIDSNERYFAKFTYAAPDHGNTLKFDFDLNMTVDTSDAQNNPQVFLLTSDENKSSLIDSPYKALNRCPISERYQPQWGNFNIERTDSHGYSATAVPNKRFPLYTQISGKDFDFSVVSYDPASTVPFTDTLALRNSTVEVELIDISSFQDAEAFFRCTDPNHDIITDIGTDSSIFVKFENDVSRVDIDNTTDLKTKNALENATFRMWVLVDNNGSIVPHLCDKSDNTCFTDLYNDVFAATDTTNKCSPCAAGTRSCYDCLRDNFGTPMCARDNFAIRPASYSIQISDTNESNASGAPSLFISDNHNPSIIGPLAAGYLYKIDANATLYSTDTNAIGYNAAFISGSLTQNLVSHLSFQTTSGAHCADTSDKYLETQFSNGKISGNISDNLDTPRDVLSNNLHANTNVGDYNYHIEDLIWTKVDQDRFTTEDGQPLKTFPGSNDCEGIVSNAPAIGDPQLYAIALGKEDKHGCGISSVLQDTVHDYKDLNIRFKPYSFDVSNLNVNLPNAYNFIYMNPEMDDEQFRHMSVNIDGNVTAQGKEAIGLSNFTSGCAAEAVSFDINFTTTRFGNTINLENIRTIGIFPHHIPFKRNYIVGNTLRDSFERNATNAPKPIDLAATEFLDDKNGSSSVNLDYNFIPASGNPAQSAVNPIQVTFETAKARSDAAFSTTHLKTDYVPEGTADLTTAPIDFLYGHVIPTEELYTIPMGTNSKIINLFVEVYCSDDNITVDQCALSHNLLFPSGLAPDSWRLSTKHTHPSDGKIELLKDTNHVININPNANIKLTLPSVDINISIPATTPRTYNTTIEMTIPPWLFPEPILTQWLGGGGWAGTGKTGLILEINASQFDTNKRTEW